ncbi:MAG: peroxiredoxin [Yoonia sp.]|nr:peroxiredoxin [Yoonia sp.]
MTITTGALLPDATLLQMGASGPESLSLSEKLTGRKVVIFGLPGAFTRTCSSAHLPSFMRTIDQFKAKSVDEVICISVNDPFVMDAWSKATGADVAGITMLSDPMSEFTTDIGMNFTAPAVGFVSRSKRYSMLVDNGIVTILNEEPAGGQCEISAGETLLDAM